MLAPNNPDLRWSSGSVPDTFGDTFGDTLGAARTFRALEVIENCANCACGNMALTRIYGRPDCIISECGTGVTGPAILNQAMLASSWHFIGSGLPQQNVLIESFKGGQSKADLPALWPQQRQATFRAGQQNIG